MSAVDRVVVVVPARDEEVLLGTCLAALTLAVDTARAARPGLTAVIVVVADRCTDRTAEIGRTAGAEVVESVAGCVGAARRAGVEVGVARLAPSAAERTWIASTDADSRVPADWLADQLDLAAGGARLVVGPAVPDRDDLDATIWQRWRARHTSTTIGEHVHGANVGFRLDDYLAAGGWPGLREHEDRHLVDALLAAGVPAAAGLPVTTSGRLKGRTPGGFSGYLRALSAD